MKHFHKVLVCLAVLVLIMTGAARADRFAIHVGDLPAVYSGDANEYLVTLEPLTGMMPPTPAALAAVVVPPPAPPTNAQVPPEAVTLCSRAMTEPTPRTQGMPVEMADVMKPQTGPPDAAFLAQLNAIYTITVPAEIQQVYEWYLKEPAPLAIGSRVGNGVVRFIMAMDRPPTGDANASPAGLKPEATRGTVRSSNGVSIRTAPWQAGSGGAIASGAQVTIIPPADGPWYQVQSGSGNGWVCGLWLNLQ